MMGNFCIPVIDIDCRKNDYDGCDFDNGWIWGSSYTNQSSYLLEKV